MRKLRSKPTQHSYKEIYDCVGLFALRIAMVKNQAEGSSDHVNGEKQSGTY